jgi:hypothetical protein
MLRDLRQVCERPGAAQAEDFRAAAAALLKRQFLLLQRPRDRDAYRLVVNHFDYFGNLFDALGWTLHRDDGFGIVGLLPRDAEDYRELRLLDSLLILCLRLLYEEGMERFEARDGCVYTQSATLLGRYEALLGRRLPPLSDYRDALRRLRRYSLIEVEAEDADGLPALRILPTVRLVTGEEVLKRLAGFAEPAEGADRDGASEPDPDAGEAAP